MSRALELVQNYKKISETVAQTCLKYGKTSVNVLAVSKYKPASDIKLLYDSELHLHHFGENYVQELVEKSQELPKDIKWHFIGSLQGNKVKELATKVENLYSVEAIDSQSKLKKLNNYRNNLDKVRIYLQINTSEEAQKSGIIYSNKELVLETINFIKNECDNLIFTGLMTIGSIELSKSSGENIDFKRLEEIKQWLEDTQGIKPVELSMGMSSDYEEAIRQGTNTIRIGTNIFGARRLKDGN